MVETTRAMRTADSRADYNNFLYAGIEPEANGSILSVLSAMARMNLDPWREAAALAAMPGKEAVNKLAALIASLPARPTPHDEPGSIAARLVKLLPQPALLGSVLAQPGPGSAPTMIGVAAKVMSSRNTLYTVIVLIVLAIGAQWFAAKKPPAETTQAAVSETTARPGLPPAH